MTDDIVQPGLFEDMAPAVLKPLTPIKRRLVDAAADIITPSQEIIPDFLHAVLCQVSLPRKRTEERVFDRTSGRVSLRIEAGSSFDGMGWVDEPMPYGTRPRLVLVHLCTEAVRTGSREVEVGRSIGEFLDRLGVQRGGGPRGGYTMFRKQMMALAACQMRLGLPTPTGAKTIKTQPISEFQAWLHPAEGQAVMWPGTMTLSHEFFESLREHAVPLDSRALGSLTHSALALDLYTWLGHRLCRVRKDDGARVPWVALKDQFGDEYNELKDFKKELRKALRQVLAVYPTARIEETTGGIRLMPSPPPIPKTQVVVPMLPGSGSD